MAIQNPLRAPDKPVAKPVPAPAHPATPATAVTPPAPAPAPAKPTVDISEIESGMIMLSPELADVAAPVNARNEKQQAMDKRVKKLHDLTKAAVSAGMPVSAWSDKVKAGIVATYFMEPDKTTDLKKLVDRAVTFHGVAVKWGTPFKATPALVTKYKLPEHYTGREVISFAIVDKRPRATSGGKPVSEVITEKSGK